MLTAASVEQPVSFDSLGFSPILQLILRFFSPDVLKAVALGATAVGIGRPFIFSYSSYGQEGTEHAMQVRHSSSAKIHILLRSDAV